jgi:uncharacterized OsmC-like protein
VADNKGICLESLEVTVTCETNDLHAKSTRFEAVINIGGQLTDRENRILFNSARLCEVSKMLMGTIDLSHRLETGRDARPTKVV